MKKSTVFLLSLSFVLTSCFFGEGPQGPRGFDGRDGIDGVDGDEGFAFEYEFSFTAPDYRVLLNFPNTFQMLDSDVALVYFLWEVTDDGTEVWRLLPQTLYFSDGVLVYNFDFTKFDVSVFLDGTVNLNGLGADLTDNWIARVVVVPAQFSGRIDYSDYEAVKAYYDLSDSKLAKPGYTKRPK